VRLSCCPLNLRAHRCRPIHYFRSTRYRRSIRYRRSTRCRYRIHRCHHVR
jgi:hypothetical protein